MLLFLLKTETHTNKPRAVMVSRFFIIFVQSLFTIFGFGHQLITFAARRDGLRGFFFIKKMHLRVQRINIMHIFVIQNNKQLSPTAPRLSRNNMKSTIEKLNDIIENPKSYQLTRNMLAYAAIRRLIRYKAAHTCDVKGSGRHVNVNDYTWHVERALRIANIPCRVGNDAPRGGMCGRYVAIDVKSFKPTEYDAEKYRGYNAEGKLIKK